MGDVSSNSDNTKPSTNANAAGIGKVENTKNTENTERVENKIVHTGETDGLPRRRRNPQPYRTYDWRSGQMYSGRAGRLMAEARDTSERPSKYGMSAPFDRHPAAIRSRPAAPQVAPTRRLLNEVRLYRVVKGINQYELADAVGVHRKTIGSIETGVSVPSVGLALALAEVLQVSVHEIFRLDTLHDIRTMARWRR